MTVSANSQLARSARGASLLISLQMGSRATTFLVNQLLLRFLSPELLGISNHLELYSVTVLTFARESLRISLGRQGGETETSSSLEKDSRRNDKKHISKRKEAIPDNLSIKIQEAVNMAYLAPLSGVFLSILFGHLYLSRASQAALRVPYLVPALYAYGIATVAELSAEPCFAVAAQQRQFSVRARAETIATVSRCIVACGLAAWGTLMERRLGALPFAAGQVSYAFGLNIVYWSILIPCSSNSTYFLRPLSLLSRESKSGPDQSTRYFCYGLAKPVLLLAMTLYAQSVLKHFLTQGDSFMISLFDNLESQGMYTLASNYGSLLARMVFQPIEESSRGVFGSLLGAATTSSRSAHKPLQENVDTALSYLVKVLRLYMLLSTGIVCLGPTMAPLLLRLVAGQAWANTAAGNVLSAYCYYLPLLAFNGILEAFVAATATPAQLQKQSLWMGGFSVVFAATSFISLKVYDLGAIGIVFANGVNMIVRIIWSWNFVCLYFNVQKSRLTISAILPRFEVVGMTFVTAYSLHRLKESFVGTHHDLIQSALIAGVLGASIAFLERPFLLESYNLLRPSKE